MFSFHLLNFKAVFLTFIDTVYLLTACIKVALSNTENDTESVT